MGGCPAPVDLTYGSGVPSPALAAQQAQNDPATAMAVMQAHPFEVEQIAMQFKVPRATAAMILLAQMQGEPMRAMAQGGFPNAGEPVIVGERGPEVFVPDVPGAIIPGPISRFGAMTGDFYPSSRAAPAPPPPPATAPFWDLKAGETLTPPPYVAPNDPTQYLRDVQEGKVPHDLQVILSTHQQSPGFMLAPFVRAEAWDRWLAGLPESENVEDRRTPEKAEGPDDPNWKGWDPEFVKRLRKTMK
jgi:hypothetical protein